MAIISIDYDDTIVYANYPEVGIMKLYSEGHTIIINTCRSGEHQKMAEEYLRQSGVLFHHINENHPDNIAQYDSDSRKIFADVYIDDKQLGGLPEHWLEIDAILREQLEKIK